MEEKVNVKENKLINWVKKHDFFSMFIICLIFVSAYSFYMPLNPTDELWTFSNVLKIVEGKTIYIDSNVIQTPLFFWIASIFLRVFGTNMLVYRIFNLLIYLALYLTLYKLFKTLNIGKLNSFIYVIVVYIASCTSIVAGANYNMMSVLLCLIGILLLIKRTDKKTDYILQGIILFLVFACKQNIGAFYLISFLISQVLIYYKNPKTLVKNVLVTGITSFILLLLFIFSLYLKGNLSGFINYAILGMGEFGTKNLKAEPLSLASWATVAILTYIFNIYIISKLLKDTKIKENAKILLSFSLTSIIIMYPIFNKYHIIMTYFFIIPAMIYPINIAISDLLEEKRIKKLLKFLAIFATLFICFKNVKQNVEYLKSDHNMEGIYYGSVVNGGIRPNIKHVLEYIESKEKENIDVKIISSEALIYTNLNHKHDTLFDLPMLGNLGKEGEEGLIEKVKQLPDNTQIFLKTDTDIQESKKLREYVNENWNKIGELNQFTIYEKK